MLRVFASLLFITIIAGCVPAGNISNENFSSDYREDERNIHAEFAVFNFTNDSSRLFIKLNTNELLFEKQQEDTFRATFQVNLRILESYESEVVKDTVRQTFHINRSLEGTGKRIYTVDFRLPPPGLYLIECNIYDSNKRVQETNYINLDNSSPQSRQNFLIHLANSPTPLFINYLSPIDSFSVNYRNEPSNTIIVKYYKRDFDLAAPPYSFDVRTQFNYRADSVFTIQSGEGRQYVFAQEGIYHLQIDTTNHEGCTIYRFNEGFPGVTTPQSLLEPLHYITTRKEFDELLANPKPKQATDKFWLDIGGSQERSRQLIKKYYSRVEKANRMFTSYTEGWRTDRGMIYIIFGSPHSVYKSSGTESWTYGEANSSLSVTFSFSKVNNPFTDNDFSLNRAPIYETTWYRAVDTWHQGRAFNDY